MEILSHSIAETKRAGLDLARKLWGGELVRLEGTLGAGKTTFAQGIAEGLGVKGPVRSPTFTLMNIHPTTHPTVRFLVHADLYRLKTPEEARELGFEEWINRADAVVVAEWPELGGAFLEAKKCIHVVFSGEGEERRIDIQETKK